MIFGIDAKRLPTVTSCYKIERKTVWSAVDRNNILVLVTEGECIFTVNNIDHTVKKNEAFIIPAEQEYTRRPKNNRSAVFYYFHFKTDTPISEVDTEAVRLTLETQKTELETAAISDTGNRFVPVELLYVKSHIALGDKAAALAERIEREITGLRIESGYLISLYFSEILGLSMQCTVKELLTDFDASLGRPVPYKLKKAMLYIRQNRKQMISLEELSDYCGISKQHIIRLFKSELGITPTQYINRLKINYAKNLIQFSPSLSMKEVSYELGFENPNYFSRLFTKLEGESPSDFKVRISLPGSMYESGVAVTDTRSRRSRKHRQEQ